MTQVFNTAQEARQWMVAHPMLECFDGYMNRWRFNHVLAAFQRTGTCEHNWQIAMPTSQSWFMVVAATSAIEPEPTPDEWEEVFVPKDGRFHVGPPHFFQSLDGVFQARNERYALECILTHASEVKIEYQDDCLGDTVFVDLTACDKMDIMELFFALQIGAKVSMKRLEGG